MKKIRRLLAIALCLCMTVSLAACSGSSSDSGSTTAAETTAADTTASGDVDTEAAEETGESIVEQAVDTVGAEDCVIGFSILSAEAEFLVAMIQGAEDKAEELGCELVIKDCGGDAQTQHEQIEDLISQEVSVIVMEPLDADAIVTVIDQATEAGIPVLTCDTTSNGGDVVCYVASDNTEMGRMGAEYIVEQLEARYGEVKGTVVNLMASLTSSNGIARSEGFHEVMDQYPDVTIIEQNADLKVEEALNTMTDILQANEQIDAVWCSGDNNAIGVIQAIKQANRYYEVGDDQRIIVVSADGGAEILSDIRSGLCDAVVSQQPITMGKMSIELAFNYVVNGEVPESDVIAVDLYTITVDNIDSDEVAEFGIWADEVR